MRKSKSNPAARWLLRGITAVCMAAFLCVPALAAVEAEENDSIETANAISVNSEVSGSISKSSDVDWFVFQIPEDGVISLTFDHDYVDSSSYYWGTYFFTSENKQLSGWRWAGNTMSAKTAGNIGVAAGTYYLRVTDDSYYSAENYRFTVNYTQSDSWEKEFNETIVTANTIPVNTKISGSMMTSSDVDWYKFELPEDGTISLTFEHDYVDSSSYYWSTYFYTNENKQLSGWRWAGNAVSARTGGSIGLAAGTYYLRVVDDSYYSSAVYSFTVNYTPSNTWEKEFNEIITAANTIQTDVEMLGSIMTSSDVDWYKFEIPENGTISITFGHDFVDSSSLYWNTAFYTSENKKLADWRWKGNATSDETGSGIGIPAGTYYLRIADDSYYSNATYHFTVNYNSGSGSDVPGPGGDEQQPEPPVVKPSEVVLNKSRLSLAVGESSVLTAEVLPSDAANKTVTWRSENTKVATVSNGRVTAVGEGSTTITASCGGASASCTVTVEQEEVKVTGISLNKKSLSLKVGETAALSAAVTPSNATDENIVWRSEDKKVATVANGKVTGVGKGTTTITASCGDMTASCSVSVVEEKPRSEVHFERVTIYFQDQFTDVPANQWYTSSVAEAFELGLMVGDSKTTFNPYGDVTVAEAVTMAARIYSIYVQDNETFRQDGGEWYQVYLDYAYEKGIISRAYYNCDVTQKASRAQFAEIFSNSLPSEALAAVNDVADGAIPDVKMGDRYAEYIYTLYRAGILAGSDANGTFNPTTYITRAEAAAIVSRMAESDNRISVTLR